MLRALPLAAKQHWAQQIQTLTFAYNATIHETTGYAPFYLMYGRVPRLPVDMVFKQVLKDPVVTDYNTYADKLMASLNVAAGIAQQHARKEQQHQADGYNKRARGTHLNVGDRVLLANKAERGKRKLADKWEPTIYTVTDRNPQTHVYKVRDEGGRTKVVHRNLMLDVSFLPILEPGREELEAGASDVVRECDPLSIDAVSELAVENSEYRTRSWINETPHANSQSGEDADDLEVEDEPHSLPDASDQLTRPPSARDMLSPSVFPNSGPTDFDSDPLVDTTNLDDTGSPNIIPPTPVADNQPDTQHLGPDRQTRTGRVVRAVNRLIENMVQKPFTRDFIQGSNRRSLSSLSLF